MYAKIENGSVVQFPYTYEMLKASKPGVSFPKSMPDDRLAEYGVFPVVSTVAKYNRDTQVATQVGCVFNVTLNRWETAWVVRNKTAEELAAANAAYLKQVTQAVQNHLDTEAQTHGYDGILSLASYAASTNPPFAAEGDAGLDWRDAVWGTCYQILADVNAGTRSIPTVEEVIAELPPMVWPNS